MTHPAPLHPAPGSTVARRRVLAASAWAAPAVAAAVATPALAASPAPINDFTAQVETVLYQMISDYRVANGLAPLERSGEIDAVARNWSVTMAETSSFKHNPDYSTQMPEGWTRVAENIVNAGYYQETSDPAQAASVLFEAWRNSPGHNANMLGDFNTSGLGVALGPDRIVYATQNFGLY